MVEGSLAKLDGIIRRTPVSQAHGRCGTTGRFLLSEGVPAVVRAIAARYRHRMPAPVWAAVCSQFVDFVVSKQPPEGAQPACPLAALFDYPDEATQCGEGSDGQGAQAADGSLARLPDGTPDRCSTGRCPKCCVVASLVRELRDIIAEEVRMRCMLGGCRYGMVPLLCRVRGGAVGHSVVKHAFCVSAKPLVSMLRVLCVLCEQHDCF